MIPAWADDLGTEAIGGGRQRFFIGLAEGACPSLDGVSEYKIAQIFGVRKHKRLRGKMHSALEKLGHGYHVLRVYGKSLVARLYEKFATFLGLEICVHRLQDLGLHKGLENLDALRKKLVVVTDCLVGLEAELLNVHVDFPLLQRLAVPVSSGKSKILGIKIQDTRMIPLMEVRSTVARN
jgi:hypothetical protein